MKTILRILSLIFLHLLILIGCPACTHVQFEQDGVKASYTTCDLFRLRDSTIQYDPETGKIEASVTRQQAISPELLDSAVRAGAAIAAKGAGL